MQIHTTGDSFSTRLHLASHMFLLVKFLVRGGMDQICGPGDREEMPWHLGYLVEVELCREGVAQYRLSFLSKCPGKVSPRNPLLLHGWDSVSMRPAWGSTRLLTTWYFSVLQCLLSQRGNEVHKNQFMKFEMCTFWWRSTEEAKKIHKPLTEATGKENLTFPTNKGRYVEVNRAIPKVTVFKDL